MRKRVKSKENIEKVKEMPCVACGRSGPSDAHHIRSRGAGGGDELTNLMSLCRICHVEIHKIGRKTFFDKYELEVDQ